MILTLFLLFFQLFCFYMLYRNNKVLNFRIKLIDSICNNDEWKSLSSEFHSISYDVMLLKFWKPLKIETWYSKKFYDILNSNNTDNVLSNLRS